MPFSPTSIANCVLWLDASDLVAIGNGNPVGTWLDKSVSARSLTSAGAARPTFNTNAFNGLPAVTFDGIQTYLSAASVGAATASGWTAFVVMQSDNISGERFAVQNGTLGTNGFVFWQDGTGHRSLSAMGVNDMFGGAITVGVPELRSGGRGAGSGSNTLRMMLNGSTHVYLATPYNDPTGSLYLGAQDGTGRFTQGSIAEVIIYNRALLSSEWDQVHQYLGGRYAITLNPAITGFGDAAPNGSVQANDPSDISLALCFRTTSTGMAVEKVRAWLPPFVYADKTGLPLPWSIYGQNPAAAGAVTPALASGSITSLTHNTWNEEVLGTPFALTANTDYYLTFYWAGGDYPVSGNPGSFGGTLTLPGGLYLGGDGTQSSAPGVNNFIRNNSFHYATGINPPDGSFNQQWYGGDIVLASGSTSTSVTAADSVSISDVLTRGALTATRSVADTVAISDALARGATSDSRTLADSLVVTEALTRGPVTMTRSISDAVAVSDGLVTTFHHTRSIADTVSISDALARSATVASRSLADSVLISETVAQSGGTKTRSLADSIPLSETIGVPLMSRPRSLSDSLPLADQILIGIRVLSRSISDNLLLHESLHTVSPAVQNGPAVEPVINHLGSSWSNITHLGSAFVFGRPN